MVFIFSYESTTEPKLTWHRNSEWPNYILKLLIQCFCETLYGILPTYVLFICCPNRCDVASKFAVACFIDFCIKVSLFSESHSGISLLGSCQSLLLILNFPYVGLDIWKTIKNVLICILRSIDTMAYWQYVKIVKYAAQNKKNNNTRTT